MRYLALVPLVASVGLTAVGLVLIAITPRDAVPIGSRIEDVLGYLVLQTALSGVGALLAWRRPANSIGWLLSGAGVVSALQFFTAGYAVYGMFSGRVPAAVAAAWIYSWSSVLMGLFVGAVTVTFPDGRTRTRTGRAAIAVLIVGVATLGLTLALRPGPLMRFPSVENPLGWGGEEGAMTLMLAAGMICGIAGLVLAVKQLIDRARDGTATERQQLKWFLWSIALFGAALLIGFPLLFGPNGNEPATAHGASLLVALGIATVPISIGIAILRYRLYDIDLLVKRTVVYASTSTALAATFFVGIVALQPILRPLTGGSELAVAASTLLSFALFQPIRRRIQDAVDRRFDRARYDAALTVEAFADQLRDEVDLDTLRADLIAAVRQTMAPAHTSLWLREHAK